MKYSLSERQKDMLRSIVSMLEEGLLCTTWTTGRRIEHIGLVIFGEEEEQSQELQLPEIWEYSRTSDFDEFVYNGFFDRIAVNSYTLNAQKIIDAVNSNFGENEQLTVPRRIEAVFGEPSADPDFQCDVFLVMPFRTELENVHSVLKTIAIDLEIVMKRGDKFASLQNVVINDVWSAINRCRLVIADCTAIEKIVGDITYKEINGNVYYEIGIADALQKPVLLLTRNMDDIPFDLRHRRFVVYQHAYNLYDALKPTITKMLSISK